MKRILLSAVALISLSNVMAQGPVVIDTVITGQAYGTNVWYSLQNDEQETAVSSNWDIALASSAAQNNPLTSSILFNSKVGKVYAIPNSNPATSFDSLATVNFAALTPLVNDDSDWAMGALRRASNTGQFDFGWGDYNSTTHSVNGSKVFVVVYNDNTKKKFYVNLVTMQGKYEIISADLAAGAPQTTQNLVLTPYTSKNFVYYKINTNTVVDREPVSASWDFEFLQYDATIAPNMQYLSFGILNNVGIEAVKVTAVGDVQNFTNYQSQTFSDAANVIGYNWKNAQVQPAVVEDSTVYFVKTADNNIWKMVFTKFTSGSTSNMNVFSKQNLTTLSVNELEKDVFVSVYPNPAANVATVVVDSKANSTVKVVSLTGQVVFETAASNGLTTTAISTENFTNGVYLVQVSNGAATSTQRLVVQH